MFCNFTFLLLNLHGLVGHHKNDKPNFGMRNAGLLHKDLLPWDRGDANILTFFKGSSLALFNLDKEKVKVPGKDRVFL